MAVAADQVAPAHQDAPWLAMYRDMLVARELGDRMLALSRQGRAAFVVTGQGHEAAQVGSAHAIRPGVDWVLPYYRDLGVMVALGMSPYEILLGVFAKADDPTSGGRQMPCHWSWPERRVVTRSSVIAANLPHAVGVAWAARLQGRDEVAIVYFGEGATSQGDFHEALNFAAIHALPVVFFCENNGYAISEQPDKQMAVRGVAERASGYGVEGCRIDGNDVAAVHELTRSSVEACRRGQGPRLIEATTYRLVPHTSADDDRRYRSRAEVEEWWGRDPIARLRERLLAQGCLTPARDREMRAALRAEVDEATERAERALEPVPQSALRHVFQEAD